jgi:hypothetical protein
MTIWYILYSFGTFFPVLVSCTKKNMATLVPDILKHTAHLLVYMTGFSFKINEPSSASKRMYFKRDNEFRYTREIHVD